jgi:hypothetical protein
MDALTAGEIQKRYHGTYAFINTKGKEMAVRFRDFNFNPAGDMYHAVVERANKGGMNQTEIIDLNETQIHNIQHNTLFNHGKSCCFYSRKPLRQFRKGYTSDNTHVTDVVVASMLDNGAPVVADPYSHIDLASVESFHNPDYANLIENAINRMEKEERIGIAITPSFGLGKSFIKDVEYILYFTYQPIAYISGNQVKHITLKQEVVDFFKYFSRGGFNVT